MRHPTSFASLEHLPERITPATIAAVSTETTHSAAMEVIDSQKVVSDYFEASANAVQIEFLFVGSFAEISEASIHAAFDPESRILTLSNDDFAEPATVRLIAIGSGGITKIGEHEYRIDPGVTQVEIQTSSKFVGSKATIDTGSEATFVSVPAGRSIGFSTPVAVEETVPPRGNPSDEEEGDGGDAEDGSVSIPDADFVIQITDAGDALDIGMEPIDDLSMNPLDELNDGPLSPPSPSLTVFPPQNGGVPLHQPVMDPATEEGNTPPDSVVLGIESMTSEPNTISPEAQLITVPEVAIRMSSEAMILSALAATRLALQAGTQRRQKSGQ